MLGAEEDAALVGLRKVLIVLRGLLCSVPAAGAALLLAPTTSGSSGSTIRPTELHATDCKEKENPKILVVSPDKF